MAEEVVEDLKRMIKERTSRGGVREKFQSFPISLFNILEHKRLLYRIIGGESRNTKPGSGEPNWKLSWNSDSEEEEDNSESENLIDVEQPTSLIPETVLLSENEH